MNELIARRLVWLLTPRCVCRRLCSLFFFSATFGFLDGGAPSALEQERIQTDIENLLLTNLSRANEQKEKERLATDASHAREGEGRAAAPAPAFDPRELVSFFKSGVDVIVQDGFSRCFESSRSQPWNWNLYLWPLWACGVLIRYCVLFPLRLTSLLTGLLLVFITLPILKVIPLAEATRSSLQRKLIRFLCGVFVFSWTGVIKYHGRIPRKQAGQIYVANHTSMIDVIVLSQMNTFSLVGQKHPGWIGFMQTHVLGIIGTVWFQRGEADDRIKSAKKMKEHIHDPNSNRLLVFPEGTCVNNEYCVQFKQGVFDMGAEVCPIAIKYNKIFVDAFWNSKAQSFQSHLVTLMCSWAVVCDVYYLEPQRILPGEGGIAFSNRVKKLIADKAGLRNASYDGYLKHFEVKPTLVQKQQKMYADVLLKRLTPLERDQIEREERDEQRRAEAQRAHRADAAKGAEAARVGAADQKAGAAEGKAAGTAASEKAAAAKKSEWSESVAVAAGPDSLSLSPSPDVTLMSPLVVGAGSPPRASAADAAADAALAASPSSSSSPLRRSASGPAGAGSVGSLGGLAAVSSSANLIQLLNAKQAEERMQAEEKQQQLRQRKQPQPSGAQSPEEGKAVEQ